MSDNLFTRLNQQEEEKRRKGQLLNNRATPSSDAEEPADLSDQLAPAANSSVGGAGDRPNGKSQPSPTLADRVSGVNSKPGSTSGVGPVANADMYGAALDEGKRDPFLSAISPVPSAPSKAEVNKRTRDLESALNTLARDNVDTSDLDAKMAEAKRAYREEKNINQWSEVAQMLANSIANYAAAAWASKHDTGGAALPNFAATDRDYQARTKNAMGEYQMETDLIGQSRKERFDRSDKTYETKKDKIRGKKDLLDTAETIYGRDVQKYEADVRDRRSEAKDSANRAEDDAKKTEAEKKQEQRLANQIWDNMQQEERLLQPEIRAIDNLVKQAQTAKSASARDKAVEALAARAGLSDEELAAIKEDPANRVEGTLYGTNESQTKQVEAISKGLYAPLKQRLDAIREQKARAGQVLGINPAPSASTPAAASASAPQQAAPAQQPAPAARKVTQKGVDEYAKKYYNGDTNKARIALQSQGFTLE